MLVSVIICRVSPMHYGQTPSTVYIIHLQDYRDFAAACCPQKLLEMIKNNLTSVNTDAGNTVGPHA